MKGCLYIACENYLRFGLVCDKALPATDFDVLLKRLSRRTLLALEATRFEVCFEFRLVIFITSFPFIFLRNEAFSHKTFSCIIKMHFKHEVSASFVI